MGCSRELMSCVGRLCKDNLYLYNSLPLIPTPPLIMAVNIGEAVGCLLPLKPSWYFVFRLDERYSALRFLRSQGFRSTTSINRLGDINIGVTDTVRGYSIIYFIWLLYLWKIFLAVSEHIYFYLMYVWSICPNKPLCHAYQNRYSSCTNDQQINLVACVFQFQ